MSLEKEDKSEWGYSYVFIDGQGWVKADNWMMTYNLWSKRNLWIKKKWWNVSISVDFQTLVYFHMNSEGVHEIEMVY